MRVTLENKYSISSDYWSNAREKSIQFQLATSQDVMNKCQLRVNAVHKKKI